MTSTGSRRSAVHAVALAVLLGGALSAPAQDTPQAASVAASPAQDNKSVPVQDPGAPPQEKKQETKLKDVEVVEKLNEARNQIVPDLGATTTTLSSEQIRSLPMGLDAEFNDVILRMPGVVQDTLGQVHVRGEHANLQYRINDVVLPEGITGFGPELSTRFVDNVRLITGSLPAQYGFHTAGIVDVTTRDGALQPGGEFSLYGGSYGTWKPSVDYGSSSGPFTYFGTFSFMHSEWGIENPTDSLRPIHDDTNQTKGFAYGSYVIDDTSRIVLMLSGSYSTYQIPNTPGVAPGTSPGGIQWVPGNFDSAHLNENQLEQNYYGVAAYQKRVGDLNFQVSAFGRSSAVHFMPDPVGDLFFNGVANDIDRTLYSGGVQGDASWDLKNGHIVRGGVELIDQGVVVKSTTTVFPTDAGGDPTGPAFPIEDNNSIQGLFYGIYLQDEWKLLKQLTVNYGARFDVVAYSFTHDNQVSPRANVIYQPTEDTTLHAGYAKYLTPPELANVSTTTVNKYQGTSNATAQTQNDPVRSETSNYYDAGVSQKVGLGEKLGTFQVGVDGYWKTARHQLDDGFFGQTFILSNFNYTEGRIRGLEMTGTYTREGLNVFANVALSRVEGKNWESAQFLFDPADLAYVSNHWVHMDHDQAVTGSFGASYTIQEKDFGSTRPFVDALYGSGLRKDGTDAAGNSIPNGSHVPSYYAVNMGVEQVYTVNTAHSLRARFEVVNITDHVYELRDGDGVGVNATLFGMRRGYFGSLAITF